MIRSFLVALLALEQVPQGNPIATSAAAAKSAAIDAGVATPTKSLDAGIIVLPMKSVDAGVAAPAMTAEVKALVDRVQAFYEKTTDFKASFKQEYQYKGFKRTQQSTGRVVYRRPGMMRWEYETPSPKTFVLAQDKAYAYDPEAKLLTRAPFNSNSLSASITFLWGKGKLADEFSIAKKDCATCAGVLLEMTPLKPDPRFQRVMLEVDPKTAQVTKSIVIDPQGGTNTVSFIDLKTNVGVDEGEFKLSPPAGTQIQDFTNAAAPQPQKK